jgi:CheY-like chemotaxis protein
VAKKVLLADDEEDILMLCSTALGGDDRYSLILARDGEEALSRAQQERPDLVFLDAMMPKMDGFEVCRILKSDPSTADVRVVMLTALAQEFDRKRADEVGADFYITKPFSPSVLLGKVDELLSSD